MTQNNPEVGQSISTAGGRVNYHDQGAGAPVLLIHGSGPGVSAWANWRMTIEALSVQNRVIAPDIVGFGYTERPDHFDYNMTSWVDHTMGFLDSLGIEKTSVVGNSFGGALALAMAIRHPDRVDKLVLMGSVGVPFTLTDGLDKVWGYTPSIENMRQLLDIFAHDRNLVSDELAKLRYEASIQPGFQESYASMFPAPRQQWVEAMTSPEKDIMAIPHDSLIIHGREDKVIPPQNAHQLFSLIKNARLHMFGNCGHWTQIEHAREFNQLVAHFLNN